MTAACAVPGESGLQHDAAAPVTVRPTKAANGTVAPAAEPAAAPAPASAAATARKPRPANWALESPLSAEELAAQEAADRAAEEAAARAAAEAEAAARAQAEAAAAASSPAPAQAPAQTGTAREAGFDPSALWRDPEFQRDFTLSYLATSEVEPPVTLKERDELQEILELMAADRVVKARDRLAAGRGDGRSAVFDFTLANIYFQEEELELAAQSYEDAVAAFPKFRRAWKNLGLIRIRLNDSAEAARAFTHVIELGGGDAVTYGLLGYAHANLEHHLAAETAYRMAALLDPTTADWQMGLARSLFKQARYADAAALCEGLIADKPDSPELWLLQANAFIGLERPLEAAENFEMAARLGRATPASLNTLGDIYVNESLYDVACERYAAALELDPQASTVRALRAAKVLAARGARDEASLLLGRIEELRGDSLADSERKDLLKLRARLAVAAGAGEREAAILEEIVALDPLDGEALILLGQHAERNDEVERAVFYYERAESLEAFEAEASRRHGQLLVRQGEYKRALPLLRRSQALAPSEQLREFLEQVEQRVPKGS